MKIKRTFKAYKCECTIASLEANTLLRKLIVIPVTWRGSDRGLEDKIKSVLPEGEKLVQLDKKQLISTTYNMDEETFLKYARRDV